MNNREESQKALESIRKLLRESKSGQSWWQPPGMRDGEYYTCDMGYVEEFLDDLEDYLSDSYIFPCI